MRPTHLMGSNPLYAKSTNFPSKKYLHKNSRIVFDQISGYRGVAKPTPKINHHSTTYENPTQKPPGLYNRWGRGAHSHPHGYSEPPSNFSLAPPLVTDSSWGALPTLLPSPLEKIYSSFKVGIRCHLCDTFFNSTSHPDELVPSSALDVCEPLQHWSHCLAIACASNNRSATWSTNRSSGLQTSAT